MNILILSDGAVTLMNLTSMTCPRSTAHQLITPCKIPVDVQLHEVNSPPCPVFPSTARLDEKEEELQLLDELLFSTSVELCIVGLFTATLTNWESKQNHIN